jgi:actin-like ATPase involved in cell morphogenesis
MEENYLPGIGLDIGTSNLVMARMLVDKQVEFRSERDAFYVMVPESPTNAKIIENSLRKRGAFTLKEEGKFYIVGKHAIEMANVRLQSVERPLKKGVISDSEVNSFGMLFKLIESLVGKASIPNELCVYTYPADPMDKEFNIIYHKQRMAEILTTLGYTPRPILEAEALAYSELFDDEENPMTGIVISCGAGMFNLGVFHMGQNLLCFSIPEGGDTIDKAAAQQVKKPETVIQSEKEGGDLDIMNPGEGKTDKDQIKIHKALAIFYGALIEDVADLLEKKFSTVENTPNFENPIPIVIAGGTSLPRGFVEKMSTALLMRKFPFKIGDIRRAADPLRAVANGCLIFARFELEG